VEDIGQWCSFLEAHLKTSLEIGVSRNLRWRRGSCDPTRKNSPHVTHGKNKEKKKKEDTLKESVKAQ